MNREVLFRGKSVDTGEWIYGYFARVEWYLADGTEVSIIIPTDATLYPHCEVELYEVVPKTVGQYVGLEDKNGTKIFEGDILGNDVTGMLCVDMSAQGLRLASSYTCLYPVVGNIHDNPELLGR